jgi:AraC-like DNA-binding protein
MMSASHVAAVSLAMEMEALSKIAGPVLNGHRPERMEIWKAKKFIRENLEEKISLVEVAMAVRICPTYLSEQFKEVTGQKFVDYVAQARVEKACELLRTTRARISEIAFASGFQSLSQFNRVFKKICGQSPRSYRARDARASNGARAIVRWY